MSFRTDLLATVAAARALSGPAFVDIRTNQLTIRTRTWDGPYKRQGTYVDSDLVLPAHYPIRHVTGQEVDGSSGRYQLEDLLVNHITPSNGAGAGYTRDQLDPPVAEDRIEILYVVTGPEKGIYSLIDARFERPFTYQLVIRRQLQ